MLSKNRKFQSLCNIFFKKYYILINFFEIERKKNILFLEVLGRGGVMGGSTLLHTLREGSMGPTTSQ